MDDWEREGMQGMFPKGFHYALHYIPTEMTGAESQRITDGISRHRVSPENVICTPRHKCC